MLAGRQGLPDDIMLTMIDVDRDTFGPVGLGAVAISRRERAGMLIKFKVAGADKAVWINPDHVSGVLGTAPEITTVYLVGGVEQRIEAQPDEVAREIDAAQIKLARDRLATP